MTGTIVRLVQDKGFGFISSEEEKKDIFFHHSDLSQGKFELLTVGSKVDFDLLDTPKGLRAGNVEISS